MEKKKVGRPKKNPESPLLEAQSAWIDGHLGDTTEELSRATGATVEAVRAYIAARPKRKLPPNRFQGALGSSGKPVEGTVVMTEAQSVADERIPNVPPGDSERTSRRVHQPYGPDYKP